MSLNKVCLIGRLGRDPEVRTMNNGNKVVSFSLATSERWRDKQTGEKREKTEWHNVVIFNEALGKIAEQWLKKGVQVYLEGAMQTRKWTDNKDGIERYVTEVVLQQYRGEIALIDGLKAAEQGDTKDPGPEPGQSNGASKQAAPVDLDDDIPF